MYTEYCATIFKMSNVPLFVSMPRDDIIHTRLLNEVLQRQCFDDPPSPTLYSCYRMCNKHGVGDKVAAATLETPRAAPPWLPPPPRPKRSWSEVFMYQQTRRQMTLVAYKCFLIRKNGMLTPLSRTKPLRVEVQIVHLLEKTLQVQSFRVLD